jgi:rhodanese-related sulfurtransferase
MKKFAFLIITALCFTVSPAFGGSVSLIEIDDLKNLLGSDEVVILDVRAGRDWSTSEFKIPGAVRASGEDFEKWGNSYPKDKKLILYCA